jgi:hypothetical protein
MYQLHMVYMMVHPSYLKIDLFRWYNKRLGDLKASLGFEKQGGAPAGHERHSVSGRPLAESVRMV